MFIIFNGANYWLVQENWMVALKEWDKKSDFKLIEGVRWVKSAKAFKGRAKMFPCSRGYQVLNTEQIKAIMEG